MEIRPRGWGWRVPLREKNRKLRARMKIYTKKRKIYKSNSKKSWYTVNTSRSKVGCVFKLSNNHQQSESFSSMSNCKNFQYQQQNQVQECEFTQTWITVIFTPSDGTAFKTFKFCDISARTQEYFPLLTQITVPFKNVSQSAVTQRRSYIWTWSRNTAVFSGLKLI